MNAVELSQLYKAIDKGSSMRRNRHSITKHDLLLETTPELTAPIAIDWAAKPNLDQSLRMPAGRTRFLGKVTYEEDQATIALTPQHHWVHQTLIPRQPLEKVRDGRVFDELTLAADLPANTYLVIFWNRSDEGPDDSSQVSPDNAKPKDDKPDHGAVEPGNSPAAPADTTTPSVNPEVQPGQTAEPSNESPFKFELPPALPRLGRLLLTGRRANKPLQLILVIHSPTRLQRDGTRNPGTTQPATEPTTPAQPQPQPDRESTVPR